MNYSVLMSVYAKEEPVYFDEAIRSMLNQTVRTDDFVIVCDGVLTDELDAVLKRHLSMHPGIIHPVYLPENIGTGAALNIGIAHCRNELVAKMDSDDISIPTRCEQQLEEFVADEKLTVLGGNIIEFTDSTSNPISRRLVPCDNSGIRRYARRRQPFNNMTVMYKKSAVLEVGGYKKMTRGEDYDLYIRLLLKDFYCRNINENLVYARIKDKGGDRRTSLATYRGFIKTRWYALQTGYSNLWDFIVACSAQTAVFLAPNFLQEYIYRRILHKPAEELLSNNNKQRDNYLSMR